MVWLDGAEGRAVGFDLKDYAEIDHGYAATVHKAQGVTVDRAHVLAGPTIDRHAAYVALTRHRSSVALHWSREDLVDRPGWCGRCRGSGPRTRRWTIRTTPQGSPVGCWCGCSGGCGSTAGS